jgi:SAM-dependent methyltransferase
MEIIPSCPVCSSQSFKNTYTVPDNEYGLPYKVNYNHCSDCDCFYQYPMPSDEQLSSFYPSAYHSMLSKSLIARIKNNIRLKNLNKFLSPGDAFMDFGCGNGSFILYAAGKNPENIFYGYEIDSKNSTTSYNEGKTIIIKGSWDYLKANMPTCKVISMHHVIEHLPDPNSTINYFYQKLTSDGVIIGQTPATDSLERKLFKTGWSGFHAPRHTVVFSRKAISKIFKNNNLAKVNILSGLNPAAYAVSLATLFNGKNGGSIKRSGFKWMFYLSVALVLASFDRLIQGSIIDFYAYKR